MDRREEATPAATSGARRRVAVVGDGGSWGPCCGGSATTARLGPAMAVQREEGGRMGEREGSPDLTCTAAPPAGRAAAWRPAAAAGGKGGRPWHAGSGRCYRGRRWWRQASGGGGKRGGCRGGRHLHKGARPAPPLWQHTERRREREEARLDLGFRREARPAPPLRHHAERKREREEPRVDFRSERTEGQIPSATSAMPPLL